MATVTTTHYSIFDYWKDKVITASGKIKDASESKDVDVLVITDWGEPNCWACDMPLMSPNREQTVRDSCLDRDGHLDLKKFWNNESVKHGCERCHIVPGSLGGEDKPSNLFLLCPECHYYSPDTTNPSSFIRWVYRKRRTHSMGLPAPNLVSEELKSEMSARGYDIEAILKKLKGRLDSKTFIEGFTEYANKRVGTHMHSIVLSSAIAAMADWLEEMWLDYRSA